MSSDGKLLAALTEHGSVQLWDVAAGNALEPIQLPAPATVTCFAFSPDGRHLATGCSDTTILVWDLAKVQIQAPAAPVTLSLVQRESLWQALADADPAQADRAVQVLAAQPSQAIALLWARVFPLPPPDPAVLKRLLADLDSSKFAVRDQAKNELAKLGESALPALRQEVKKPKSLEVIRRLELLIAHIEGSPCSPETLRLLRVVELLEQCASAEGRKLLERLASGVPECRVTEAAADALTRLSVSGR
jgi:hypothetical protein